jgi:hypothetical protein
LGKPGKVSIKDYQDFLALLLEMEEDERMQSDESLPAGRQAPRHAPELSGETHRGKKILVEG